jgi:hypothetical protein
MYPDINTIYYGQTEELSPSIVNNFPHLEISTPKFSRKVLYPHGDIRIIELDYISDFHHFKNHIISFLDDKTYDKTNAKIYYLDDVEDWVLLENEKNLQTFLLQNTIKTLKVKCKKSLTFKVLKVLKTHWMNICQWKDHFGGLFCKKVSFYFVILGFMLLKN